MSVRWNEVTERIKAMTRATTFEQTREVARDLGVSETTLTDSLEGRSRRAAIRVIAALARRGVDAKWMLLGEVDPTLHRRMLESAEHDLEGMVRRLVTDASRPTDRGTGEFPSPR